MKRNVADMSKAIELIKENSAEFAKIDINEILQRCGGLQTEKIDSAFFELLVYLGVGVNEETFQHAIDKGMVGLVKLLVNNFEIRVNNDICFTGQKPIIRAIGASSACCTEKEQAEIVEFLISKGADVHVNNNAAYDMACEKKLYKVLKVLLNADKQI